MLGALCFGTVFGFPFIIWGLLLIFDRDRTWQNKVKRSRSKTPLQRTPAWDKRQIILGSILVAFGIILFIVLAMINIAAQTLSPPPPF